jgi:Subtilase family
MVSLAGGWPSPARADQVLLWKRDKTVDANVTEWPLHQLLNRLASASGWKVFVEPGLDQRVSASFKNLPQGEALKQLLDEVNYALLPQSRGLPRLYVYRHSISGATERIKGEPKPGNWLRNEIIVTLGPNAKTDIDSLAAELGAKITGRAEDLHSYRLEFATAEAADKAREKLEARTDLEASDNYAYQRPVNQASSSAPLSSLFPIDPKPVSAADQITVALVDTAIQPLEGKMKDFVLPSVSVSGGVSDVSSDAPTHATSMAQTLLNSLARTAQADDAGKVRVLPVDIYGGKETTTTFEVAQGLYRAIQANANVINLSLGGTGDSPVVEYLLQSARQKNILVFASAGNTPTTDPTYPAASPNVIAVTASDWNGNLAPYANRGDFVEVKAPGNSLVRYGGQTYVSTGTSTATAFISGQAAALAAQGVSPQQAADTILQRFDIHAPPRAPGPR